MQKIPVFILISFFLTYNYCFCAEEGASASSITRTNEMIEKDRSLRENITKDEKMLLKKVILTGITLVDKERIREVLKPFRNHWISKSDIQLIIDSVLAIYKDQGYGARISSISYRVNRAVLYITIEENTPN